MTGHVRAWQVQGSVWSVHQACETWWGEHGVDGADWQQALTLVWLDEHPGAAQYEIGNRLGLSAARASRLVAGLLDRDLVEQVIPPGDTRRRHHHLTDAGRTLAEACAPAIDAWEEHLRSVLGSAAVDLLCWQLDAVVAALTDPE